MMELMMQKALNTPVDPVQIKKLSEVNKEWHLVFLRNPVKVVAEKNSSRVCGVHCAVTRLEV